MTNPTNKDMRVAGSGSGPETDPEFRPESDPEFTPESAHESPREFAPESTRESGSEAAPESEVATSFPPPHPDGPRNEAAEAPEPDESLEPAEPLGAAEVPEAGPAPFEQFIETAEADRLRKQWSEVQAGFIDDPEGTVREADELAAEIVNALGRALAERKRSLDEHGRDGTEELRLTLRGYREFVDRMLAA